jgi:transposase
MAAFVQLRHDTPGRAYYRRKLEAGKTPMEAMRCLKRRLSDAVYRQLLTDSRTDGRDEHQQEVGAGSGGHSGATLTSSAADLPPHIDTSEKPQPEPATTTLPAHHSPRQPRPPTRKTTTRRRSTARA